MLQVKRSEGIVGFIWLILMASFPAFSQTSLPSGRVSLGAPRVIRFKGLLKDMDGQPINTKVNVSFAIYNEPTGGSPLWEETQTVQFSNGQYSVLIGLGSETGIPVELFRSGEACWLGVRMLVDGEQERPRVFLASVPYALKASDADTLGGLPASAFIRSANQISAEPDPTAIVSVQSTDNSSVRPTDGAIGVPTETTVAGKSKDMINVKGVQYATVQAAINALPVSGGTVNIPCGTYVGPTKIPSGVWLNSLCQPLSPRVAIGGSRFPVATSSTILTYTSGLTIVNSFGIGLNNLLLDFSGGSGKNLKLAGVSHSVFRIAVKCPLGPSGGTCVDLTDGGATNTNTMFNKFDMLWTYGGNTSIRLAGTSSGVRFVTNNVFSFVVIDQPYQRGLDFAQYCDSNTFDYVFIDPYNVASPYSPVIFNSANPTTDMGVESIQVKNLTIGAPYTGTCDTAIAFNVGYGNTVFGSEISCTNIYRSRAGAAFIFTESSQAGTGQSPPQSIYFAPDFTDALYLRGSTLSSSRSPNVAFCDPDAHCFHERKEGKDLIIITPSGGSYALPDTATNLKMSGIIPTSFTTSASSTDSVTVQGMTAAGHCLLQPTNSEAAEGVARVYISNKTINQITVSHPAISGWTFDVLCAP